MTGSHSSYRIDARGKNETLDSSRTLFFKFGDECWLLPKLANTGCCCDMVMKFKIAIQSRKFLLLKLHKLYSQSRSLQWMFPHLFCWAELCRIHTQSQRIAAMLLSLNRIWFRSVHKPRSTELPSSERGGQADNGRLPDSRTSLRHTRCSEDHRNTSRRLSLKAAIQHHWPVRFHPKKLHSIHIWPVTNNARMRLQGNA